MSTRTLPLLLAVATPVLALAAQSPTDLARHYSAVEAELRARDVAHLTPDQQRARAHVIDALRAYRLRADFGLNPDVEDGRRLQFVDGGGRRCAVANLLDQCGAGALTLSVARLDNEVWVFELADQPEFCSWLESVGLTLEEAARIQAPSRNGRSRGRISVPSDPPPSEKPQPATPQPATPQPARPPSVRVTRPARSTPPTGGPTKPTMPTQAGTPVMGLLDDDEGWPAWWDANRLEFLDLRVVPATTPAAQAPADPFAGQRSAWAARARLGLRDGDAQMRSASAIALARIAGEAAVDELRALLDDASLQVRSAAILGLGVSGSQRAVHDLLHLAVHGRPARSQAVQDVMPAARSLAVVALGLAGLGDQVGNRGEEARLALRTAGVGQLSWLTQSVLLHQRLAPCDTLLDFAHIVGADRVRPVEERCRAIEALSGSAEAASLRIVLDAAGSRDAELRRSAAEALGRTRHTLVLPALLTQCEMEKEPLTHGLLLVAIGRRGGTDARNFLLRAAKESPRRDRPWIALALGILSRDACDPEIVAAIREGLRSEANQQTLGAWFLAAGMAREATLLPDLSGALVASRQVELRAVAAEALAMIGGHAVREILRQRLVVDPCPFVRGTLGELLGRMGAPDDLEAVVQALERNPSPPQQERLARAVADFGSEVALARLGAIHDADQHRTLRFAALTGAGQLFAGRAPHRAAAALRGTNLHTTPEWFGYTNLVLP